MNGSPVGNKKNRKGSNMATGDARGGGNINVVMQTTSISLTPTNPISSSRKQYDPESQEMLIN
jgi:hypothetical protein